MTALAGVVNRLQSAGIPFALVGASAMAAHGVSRATADIDLMTIDTRVLTPGFWQGATGVDVRRGDHDDPLAGVVRISAPGQPTVDVIVGRHGWQRRLLRSTGVVRLDGVELPVLDRPGLILMKLYAGGPQDGWDIEQLLAGADESTVSGVEEMLPELPPDAVHFWRRIRAAHD
jgi:hypothetical protein